MELKAVNEYEAPSYSTYDESRNKFFRSIMSCKKVSVGLLVMLLLYDKVVARPYIDISSEPSMPLSAGGGNIIGTCLNIYTLLWDIGILITIVVILCGVIYRVKLRKVEDEVEKEEKKKKCNLRVRSAVISSLRIIYVLIKHGVEKIQTFDERKKRISNNVLNAIVIFINILPIMLNMIYDYMQNITMAELLK